MIAQHSASEKVDSSDTALFLSLRDTANSGVAIQKTHTQRARHIPRIHFLKMDRHDFFAEVSRRQKNRRYFSQFLRIFLSFHSL